jgi:hypothetical protein
MRLKFKRRKVVRTGIVTMLAAAALVITGCDFTNVRHEGGYTYVAIKRSASDQLIFHCTGNPGQGRTRAGCVLDSIWGLCNRWEQDGFPPWDCANATNWRPYDPYKLIDVELAIQAVTGPYADCLAVAIENYNWYGASGGFCDNTYP